MSAYYVNVDCAHIYAEDTYRSPLLTQAVLWEEINILKTAHQFSKIICEDGYEGWISNHQICESEKQTDLRMVTQLLTHVYEEGNRKSNIIRDAGAGCYLPVLSENNGLCQTLLPDGQKGFVEKGAFNNNSNNQRQKLISISKNFLGIPYVWGGKTPRGLDCSGFVQLLHKLTGIDVRRDSPMQFEDAKMVGENILDGKAGDLLFFVEDGNRISHVAVKLENDKIVHSRGMVKINSLENENQLYDEKLIKDFIAVKTFL